ncbi:MAG: phenylalanine--tRNA ligase beta subunit-related protein [Acidobacteriota bacterium]
MSEIYYSVANEVFARFPGYARGVVIAHGVRNGDSSAELITLLREAESSLRTRLTIDQVNAEPRFASWREAFRWFGAKPSDFRASVEAMARRVLRNQEIPSINALVDIGNTISLRHLMPAGGHAIDVVKQEITLRPAKGEEDFVAFGSTELEHPVSGEIILAEGNIILTRRWCWRQANHTLTLPETTAIEFNVDGLPPIPRSEVEEACQEMIALTTRFCGGRARYEVLSRENPRIKLSE